MLLSKKSNKLIAITCIVMVVSFQSIDVMARIGGSSRSSGFSNSHNYTNSYSNSSRAGGGNNTGMQRNDIVNAERQKSGSIPNQSTAQQPTQVTQPAPSKIGLGHVAGAALAGAAVGYMLNSHNNNQPIQNNGGASGQFDGPNNGQPSGIGFPWGTILMFLLGGLGLMWLYKRSTRLQAVGSTIKEVLNPVPVSSSQTDSSFISSHQAFEAEALTFFNALQNANNKGDIDFMRKYSVDEIQNTLIDDIRNRTSPNNSRFSLMAAKVIDMSTEGNQSIASVRFTGMVGEENSAFEPMDEVWHLVRRSEEWQLAGIEQF